MRSNAELAEACRRWHALKGDIRLREAADRLESVEELYQNFKARLIADLMVDVHGTSHYGNLVERETSGGESL
jgi:hypothetical protein